MNQASGWMIRKFDRAADAVAVGQLDTSYTTELVYAVTAERDSLRLGLTPTPVRTDRFPIDLDQPRWEHGYVAVEDGAVRGFIATRFEAWNRRLAIWHFYVDSGHRRRGIGRALMEQALEDGCLLAATMAWVETSNVNGPGIDAYRRLGFSICGFDLTLYNGTPSDGQFAVYLSQRLTE
jgi:ribosomal protein S18 acetylase RimI-like enzyme